MDYLDRIAALPLPTVAQTAAFTEQVAENHSWYKHLPFFPPGAPFVLFPNPHAGETVDEHDGRFVTSALAAGDYFQHHSRLATAEYRGRFGHWDYWVGVHPRVLTPVEGPWLYEGGGRELLPADLAERWTCRVTAFLRPGPMLAAGMFERERGEFLQYARENPSDPDAARYRDFAARVVAVGGPWGNDLFVAFMEGEAAAQRQILHQKLMTIRAEWAAAAEVR